MSNFAIIILELDLNNHFHAHISYLITRDALTRGTIVYMYIMYVSQRYSGCFRSGVVRRSTGILLPHTPPPHFINSRN